MGQPSIVYECVDGVREVLRERHGGLSPGDVIARESTQSNPDTGLPEFDLPGRGDLGDHCGEEFPAFACQECGHPVYIGNTCYSPVCSRCWAGSVKRSVISAASKIENHRYDLYYDQPGDQDVRTNHVVASPPPNIKFDSENPLERALLSIQEILPQFLSEPDNRSFYSIYHPWRIKPEYRKDIYDHGGEEADGNLRAGVEPGHTRGSGPRTKVLFPVRIPACWTVGSETATRPAAPTGTSRRRVRRRRCPRPPRRPPPGRVCRRG